MKWRCFLKIHRNIIRKIRWCLVMAFLLTACGQKEDKTVEETEVKMDAPISDWREQYDLGMRYLEEEEYEQAIVAFTAAIEIDPKQPEIYIARGRAYIFSGETEEHLMLAQTDYEMVLSLDETYAEAYLGLADVYIRRGEYDEALKILKQGLEETGGSEDIENKITEIENGIITDTENKTRRMSGYDEEGNLVWYHDYFYDENGRETKAVSYDSSGVQTGEGSILYDDDGNCIQTYISMSGTGEIYGKLMQEYDNNGRRVKQENYYDSETLDSYDIFEYDSDGKVIKRSTYGNDGILWNYYINEYDLDGNIIKTSCYDQDDTLRNFHMWEYNEDGYETRMDTYDSNGNLESYETYEYDESGRRIDVQRF